MRATLKKSSSISASGFNTLPAPLNCRQRKLYRQRISIRISPPGRNIICLSLTFSFPLCAVRLHRPNVFKLLACFFNNSIYHTGRSVFNPAEEMVSAYSNKIPQLMTRPLKELPIEELKRLLRRETKAFIDGLEHGLSITELKTLRATMKEVAGIIEERTKRRGNFPSADPNIPPS